VGTPNKTKHRNSNAWQFNQCFPNVARPIASSLRSICAAKHELKRIILFLLPSIWAGAACAGQSYHCHSLTFSMTSLLSWRTIATCALVLSYELHVLAANADAWRSRSIYQSVFSLASPAPFGCLTRRALIYVPAFDRVITDRFALPQANPPLPPDQCNVTAHTWCGGTWASIEQNLDYIQVGAVVSPMLGTFADQEIVC
jgi:hypothetical protein